MAGSNRLHPLIVGYFKLNAPSHHRQRKHLFYIPLETHLQNVGTCPDDEFEISALSKSLKDYVSLLAAVLTPPIFAAKQSRRVAQFKDKLREGRRRDGQKRFDDEI